jgi:hypothetical protein
MHEFVASFGVHFENVFGLRFDVVRACILGMFSNADVGGFGLVVGRRVPEEGVTGWLRGGVRYGRLVGWGRRGRSPGGSRGGLVGCVIGASLGGRWVGPYLGCWGIAGGRGGRGRGGQRPEEPKKDPAAQANPGEEPRY